MSYNSTEPEEKGREKEKMKQEREATFKLLIGTNGTGKSKILKRFLALNKRNLICFPNSKDSTWDSVKLIDVDKILQTATGGKFFDFEQFFNTRSEKVLPMQQKIKKLLSHEIQTFTGDRKIRIKHPAIFKIIVDEDFGFFNGGLFLDDFKSCISHNNLPAHVRALLDSRRHYMVDIFAATHAPKDIPPDFMSFNPDVYLFKTSGNFETAKHKYKRFEALLQAQEKINAFTDPNRPGYKPEDNFKFLKV